MPIMKSRFSRTRYAIRENPHPAFGVPVAPLCTIMTSKESIPSPAQGVGPTYWPDGEKPTATVSKEVSYENVHVLSQTPQLIALLT